VSAAGSNLPGSPAWLVVLAGWLLISLLLPMVLIDLAAVQHDTLAAVLERAWRSSASAARLEELAATR
jgi:hypothetical protein